MTHSTSPCAGDDPRYRIVGQLGSGGAGTVLLAEWGPSATPVVIRILDDEVVPSSSQIARMRFEAQAVSWLVHPNVISVTDFDVTADGRPFVVVERLSGRTLHDELAARGGRVPVGEAIDVTRRALEGLAAAHDVGLVHQDIRPHTLFICDPTAGPAAPGAATNGRRIKLLGAGFGKALDGRQEQPVALATPNEGGVVVGTPRFLAPEQTAGQAVDHLTDVYAMGLLLYQLLAGRGPFDDAPGMVELMRAQLHVAPQAPSHYADQRLPPELDATVLRCIATRPADRFPSARALSAELDELVTRLASGGNRSAAPCEAAARASSIGGASAAGPAVEDVPRHRNTATLSDEQVAAMRARPALPFGEARKLAAAPARAANDLPRHSGTQSLRGEQLAALRAQSVLPFRG